MKVKVMFYEKQYERKPEGSEIGAVQKGLKPTEIEIEDLATAMSRGATFKPAFLNGTKSSDFISQQLFALDFDEGTTIQNELNRCRELNIMPVFGYTTFSHKEEQHKFRLVFCADRVISDIGLRNSVQLTLMSLFQNVDVKCKDISRLFFGGKQLISSDYEQRFDIDWLLDEYKSEDLIDEKDAVPFENKERKEQTPTNYNSYDENLLNLKVSAISALNVEITRNLLGWDKTTTDKEENKSYSISCGCMPMLVSLETPTLVWSQAELYELINQINLNEYLGIPEGTMVKCILSDHDDSTPSAHIFFSDSGTPLYKCFGCDKARTIIGITEELAHCKRSEAIEFIKKVYNIILEESDWVREQKQLMVDSANYLDTEEFQVQFPYLSSLIRTRKSHIQSMLLHFTRYVSDNLKVDGKPIFYASYDTLMRVCNIKKSDRQKLSQTLTLCALLGMLTKVELGSIPEKELKQAKSIAAKHGFKKITNFYQFPEYGCISLENGESNAKILRENNITLAGLGREYVLRTFSEKTANKVFPQYQFENNRGTSDMSDTSTIKLVNKIAKKIEKQGYIFEAELTKTYKNNLQWKRSITEILDSYGWQKVKLNKVLKDKYGIVRKGYPFLIIPKEQ